MSNPIGQILAAISSLIVLLIAFTIFDPMISGVLAGLVTSAISGPGPMGYIATNSGALLLTMKIILMGIKVFAFFVIFAVLARLFIYLGFFTEEQAVY